MKKFTLLLLIICSLAANAQENFPYKRPLLMLNKTVTVKHCTSSEKFGFGKFYQDADLKVHYKPVDKYSTYTAVPAVLGREFTVAAVDSFLNWKKEYEYKFKLQDTTETIYYWYTTDSGAAFFPFEVKDGLALPDGFYCDYVERDKLSSDPDAYMAFIDFGMFFRRELNFDKKIKYWMSFAIYSDYKAKNTVSTVILVMENNKTIKKPIPSTFAKWSSEASYKYEFTMTFDDIEMALLKANKVVGIRIEDKVIPFMYSQKLLAIANCISAIPLAKR